MYADIGTVYGPGETGCGRSRRESQELHAECRHAKYLSRILVLPVAYQARPIRDPHMFAMMKYSAPRKTQINAT